MPRIPRLAAYAAVFALALSASACSEVQKTSTESSDKVAGDVVTTIGIGDKEIKEGGDAHHGPLGRPGRARPDHVVVALHALRHETICEKLYDIDADGGSCRSSPPSCPSSRDDGRTVRIPLRDGVKFADGTPFDAEAVRHARLERHLTKEDSARASEMGPIEQVEAVDDRTVELTLRDSRSRPLTASLADRAGMIMSPTALDGARRRLRRRTRSASGRSSSWSGCRPPRSRVERDPALLRRRQRPPRHDHLPDHDRRQHPGRQPAVRRRPGRRHASRRGRSSRWLREPGIGLLQTGSLGYQGITFNVGNTDGVGEPPRRDRHPDRRRTAGSARPSSCRSTARRW